MAILNEGLDVLVVDAVVGGKEKTILFAGLEANRHVVGVGAQHGVNVEAKEVRSIKGDHISN